MLNYIAGEEIIYLKIGEITANRLELIVSSLEKVKGQGEDRVGKVVMNLTLIHC